MFRIKQEEFSSFVQDLNSCGISTVVIETAWAKMLANITDDRTPGRPRLYKDNAESMRAYRLRKKQNVSV